MRGVFDKVETAILTQPTLIDGDQPVSRIVLFMLPAWASHGRSRNRAELTCRSTCPLGTPNTSPKAGAALLRILCPDTAPSRWSLKRRWLAQPRPDFGADLLVDMGVVVAASW